MIFDRAFGYRLPTARYANDVDVLSIADGEGIRWRSLGFAES
jgi:hypothetical protein